MNKKLRNENYIRYVERKSPKSSWFKSLFHAFLVGGAICVFGQMVSDILKSYFPLMDLLTIGAWASVSIIVITIILTGLGVFDRIARFGGAGTVVPISGFANSIASCAIEFKKEGLVFGLGAKMFYIAGPVIANGVLFSLIVGLISLIF
ncbi:MAG: SpoVA/SpoVAEb family sporulation membrane protein [Clostridia bacterium]|nr:SpoVA/SpoVAEb family sporulation membrane protein [Clostridia bacterium]